MDQAVSLSVYSSQHDGSPPPCGILACSSLYPPRDEDRVPTYPYECTSEPCHIWRGCDLLKLGSTPDRKSIGVPKHPIVMQDFHDFVECLLSQPGMETAIQQSGLHVCNDNMAKDIATADGIRAIKGPFHFFLVCWTKNFASCCCPFCQHR
jgi:hypothetical protein